MKSTFRLLSRSVLVSALTATVVSCSDGDSVADSQTAPKPMEPTAQPASEMSAPDHERYAYFGDLHVHTTYSMDAFNFGTLATPDDAYRYAQGEAIKHPGGFDMQLDQPLDFYAVTDHGFYLGVVRAGADTSTEISRHPAMESIHNLNAPQNLNLASIPTRNFRAWIGGFRRAMASSEP